MKAFVTGGSGFVGRNLIEMLRAQGWEVRALARSDKASEAVRAAGAEPVRGDLDDEHALVEGMRGCSHVFHCAAKVEQFGRRADFVRINVDGTQRVLDAARAAGAKRVVHVSTEAVLCGTRIVGVDETAPRAKHPVGLYAETKGLAEDRVLAANRDGLETVIVRPRFIWGRGDTTLLAALGYAVRSGKFAWIAGGHHLTSTCHVRNVCEGTIAAAERGRPGEIYFLTDGAPVEFREFITRMLATQKVTPQDRSIPRWLAGAAGALLETLFTWFRPSGQPPLTRMTVRLIGEEVTVRDDKARRELGYRAHVSVDEGLSELSAASTPVPSRWE
jgi:nucleoside-diphosphate-sugar epimerase